MVNRIGALNQWDQINNYPSVDRVNGVIVLGGLLEYQQDAQGDYIDRQYNQWSEVAGILINEDLAPLSQNAMYRIFNENKLVLNNADYLGSNVEVLDRLQLNVVRNLLGRVQINPEISEGELRCFANKVVVIEEDEPVDNAMVDEGADIALVFEDVDEGEEIAMVFEGVDEGDDNADDNAMVEEGIGDEYRDFLDRSHGFKEMGFTVQQAAKLTSNNMLPADVENLLLRFPNKKVLTDHVKLLKDIKSHWAEESLLSLFPEPDDVLQWREWEPVLSHMERAPVIYYFDLLGKIGEGLSTIGPNCGGWTMMPVQFPLDDSSDETLQMCISPDGKSIFSGKTEEEALASATRDFRMHLGKILFGSMKGIKGLYLSTEFEEKVTQIFALNINARQASDLKSV